MRPEPEEPLLDALARLSAAEQLTLGEGTRYAGAFRALGLVVPVWDLPADVPAEDWVGPATEFQTRLETALAVVGAADLRRAAGPRRPALPPGHPALTLASPAPTVG